MYTAFDTDVFSRRIVGWALSDSMRTEALPLQSLSQAIACAKETTGLIHHSDHGSQYVSIVYNEHLAEHTIIASTGRWVILVTMRWRKALTALTKMSLSIPGGGMMLLT